MKIAIKTLGCKSNRYESDRLVDILNEKHQIFELNEGATSFQKKVLDEVDIFVVNTCTVTQNADRKSRQAIRSFKHANPSCEVIIFGCGSNVAKDSYEEMEEVDYIANDADGVLEIIKNIADEKDSSPCTMELDDGTRTRALVKIQDGCNNYCTYCIIPRARGPEYSYPSKDILAEVMKKEAAGYKEIVLTGIIMSNWEEDGKDLPDLIELLIQKTKNARFRLSSFEPKSFSGKFIKLFETGRLCPHIHMSLQSGSNAVLKRMKRNYTKEKFFDICEKMKRSIYDLALTTDVIVGFPGETDEEFSETRDFAQSIGFLKMHVFPYSQRKNTAAYYMKPQITKDIKKERAEILRKLSDDMGMEFKKSFIGREFEVLVEEIEIGHGADRTLCRGLTPNYLDVQFFYTGGGDIVNKLVKVRLKRIKENGVFEGEVL